MKKAIVFFLLLIFTIQSTKSLWIITSFHINRDYIAANLCINRFDKIPTCKGQCVLSKELGKEQKSQKKSLVIVEKDSIFIAPQLPVIDASRTVVKSERSQFSFSGLHRYTSFLLTTDNPPELS